MDIIKPIVFVLFLGVAVFGAKMWLDMFERKPCMKHFFGVAFMTGCTIFWIIRLVDSVVK